MENYIAVSGTYRRDDTIRFKAIKTIYTGTGSLDYEEEILEIGVTEEIFDTDDCDEQSEKYFRNKFAEEGFEFDCFID